MRYKETGEVHMDFHRTTNGTIAYLRKTYGEKFLDEVFRRTAQDVLPFRSMPISSAATRSNWSSTGPTSSTARKASTSLNGRAGKSG